MSKSAYSGMLEVITDPGRFVTRRIEDQFKAPSSLHANLSTAGLASCLGILIGVLCWMAGLR